MSSRSCTKSYGRKVNSVAPSSIQFDKLFRENSNRPSAAKSAGTVGKWGITSFTSIRSTNINGKRSDIRGVLSAKRAKLDYDNQNSHVSSAQDPFSFDSNEKTPATPPAQPKKFFKSRNVAAATAAAAAATEETPSEAIYRQVPDSQYGFPRKESQQQKAPKCSKKAAAAAEAREESKPPIVLRICKGTAKFVCSDNQDPEPDTYRISTTVAPSKVTQEVKVKKEESKPRQQHVTSSSSSVSIALDEDTRRTTRSRAKNQPTKSQPAASTPSGLSLTLRKSVTDSNNTLISHYDIVKTECEPPSYAPKTVAPVEPLIGRDQPLPTTTQELIDILSSDVEPSSSTKREPEEIKTEPLQSAELVPEVVQEEEKRAEPAVAAKTLVDQDWFSGSEDSESVSGGNVENEVPAVTNVEDNVAPPRQTDLAAKPATKKGSIFKSRQAGTTNGKRRALYKHKWSDNDKDKDQNAPASSAPSAPSGSNVDVSNAMTFDEEEFDSTAQLTRVTTYPENADPDLDDEFAVTSVRCGKNVKGFYTVVKNVKKAHQIQESGEFQEFNDDVEYILDTLRENNPNATRCLSAIRLASKCMAPAFRMHVRAHGTVAKFFKALHDATKDQSLGLCTATVMFVLSQDRLAMDLDRDCLELMLSLLESDASHKDALDDCGLSHVELQKNKEKVRQLCADIQAQGHAKHLNLDNITVGQLAMETLLSLTSRRAGEWFKEELRELGGLEHIVKTIKECHRHIIMSDIPKNGWNDPLLDKLRKVDRCLRVLENVTYMNEENQVYLLKYDDGVLVSTLASLYHLCGQEISTHPIFDPSDKSSTGAVVRECLFAIVKVFINLTHRFNRQSFGSKTVGSQAGIIDCSLYILLRVPESLPEEKRFDMMMLALILLINLVEQCDDNKQLFIESKAPLKKVSEVEESAVEALIELFYKQEELARAEEQKTDAILDGKKDSEQTETVSTTTKSQEEFIEETVAKLLQKAGRHMEHTLIAAYVVLLLGYLVMDNKDHESLVRSKLPDEKFATMVTTLQKFFNFMNLTASNEVSSCGIAATEKVIKFLKLSDARVEEERNALPLPAMEDPSIMYPS